MRVTAELLREHDACNGRMEVFVSGRLASARKLYRAERAKAWERCDAERAKALLRAAAQNE